MRYIVRHMIEKITNESLAAGQIIREPVGDEKGYWVGCPGAYYDADDSSWYLTYRVRRPAACNRIEVVK